MLKIAFVGCGAAMREHLRVVSSTPETRVVGCCDIEERAASEAATACGCDAFADAATMYDKVKPDAVYVCVPPFAHGAIEEEALRRGIHLFIDKPIALDPKTAKSIGMLAKRSEAVVSVGYHFRYFDSVVLAKKLLKGKPLSLVMGQCLCPRRTQWWWRRMDKSGGQMMTDCSHLLDLIRHLAGEVGEVHGVASNGCMNKLHDWDIHDSTAVTLRMKSGASACIAASCVNDHRLRVHLEVVTPEMSLKITEKCLKVQDQEKRTIYDTTTNAQEEADASFLEAARGGRRTRIRCVYGDALKTFLVAHAVNESLRSGLPVKP